MESVEVIATLALVIRENFFLRKRYHVKKMLLTFAFVLLCRLEATLRFHCGGEGISKVPFHFVDREV